MPTGDAAFLLALFVLPFGLATVQLLLGLRRTLAAASPVRLGWLTPLLAAFVTIDAASFGRTAWQGRDSAPHPLLVPSAILAFSAVYWLAARLAFPGKPADWSDLDEYYLSRRRRVVGLILLCDVAATSFSIATGPPWTLFDQLVQVLYFALLAGALAARGNALNAAILEGLIIIYLVDGISRLF